MEAAIHREAARVRRDVDRTRAAFSDLQRAEKTAPGVDALDSGTRLLLQLKADTRHLRLYLSDLILTSPHAGGGDKSRANSAALTLTYLDMEKFEKRFSFHDSLQGHSSATMDMICELSRLKDSALLKIVNALLGALGIDQVVKSDVLSRNEAGSHRQLDLDSYASQGGSSLLHLFATFKAVEEKLRRLCAMSTDKDALIKEVESLRSMVEHLTAALEASRKQSSEAAKELEAVQSSHGRHQMLLRAQARADALEAEKVDLERGNSALVKDKFLLTQQASSMMDNLITSKAQLADAKAAYQRDVAHLLPLVQERITQKLETKKTLEGMSTIADMGMIKANAEVRRSKAISEELLRAEEQRQRTEVDLQGALKSLQKVTTDRDRLLKINLVVTAAKTRFHQETLELQRALAAAEGERDDLRAQVREQHEAQELLDSLYARLDASAESAERSKDLYLVEKTANLAFALQNQQLMAEVEGINSGGGMTELKKKEWAEREEVVARLKKVSLPNPNPNPNPNPHPHPPLTSDPYPVRGAYEGRPDLVREEDQPVGAQEQGAGAGAGGATEAHGGLRLEPDARVCICN